MKTKIPICRTIFGFSSKTSFFAGLGALFGNFLVIFLVIFKLQRKKKTKEASF